MRHVRAGASAIAVEQRSRAAVAAAAVAAAEEAGTMVVGAGVAPRLHLRALQVCISNLPVVFWTRHIADACWGVRDE